MDETQPAKYRTLSESFRGLTDRLPSFRSQMPVDQRFEDKETLILNDLVALHHNQQHSSHAHHHHHHNQLESISPDVMMDHQSHHHCPHHVPVFEDSSPPPASVPFRYIQENLDNQTRDCAFSGPTNAASCYYNPLTSAVSIRYEQPPSAFIRHTGPYSSVKERMEAKMKAKRVACYCRVFVITVVAIALAIMATGAYLYTCQPQVLGGGSLGKSQQTTWSSVITWLEEHNFNFFGNTPSVALKDAALESKDAIAANPSDASHLQGSLKSLSQCPVNCTHLPARHLLEHYYQSGCRPVSHRDGCMHCPDYFTCPNLSGQRKNDPKEECRFQDRHHVPGDVFFNRHDKSCQFCGCRNVSEPGAEGGRATSSFPWNRMASAGVGVVSQTIHREGLNSTLEVVCVELLCPYIRPNRSDCHLVETGNECCPRRQVCPEQFDEHDARRDLRCHWKGREYRYDEMIRPALEEDPCLQCRCNEAWNDRDPAKSASSSLEKCSDFSNPKYHSCTPIYANSTCCPVDFVCSDPANSNLTSKSHALTARNSSCRLGDLHREMSTTGITQIRVAKLYKGKRTLCSRCECRVPPMFTCTLEKLKDCDKEAQSDKDDAHGQQRGHSAGLTRQLAKPTITTKISTIASEHGSSEVFT